MPASTTLADAQNEAIYNTTTYLGLLSEMPTATAAGVELTSVNAPGYARIAVPAASWGASTNGQKTNTAAITFAAATADWPNVVGIQFFDALTNGNAKDYDALVEPIQNDSGYSVQFAIGAITVKG